MLVSVDGDQADPPTTKGRNSPLRARDEPQGDSLPPVKGVHGESVQVASPTVPRPAEGTHDLATDLSHEECCGIMGDELTDAFHVVGRTGGSCAARHRASTADTSSDRAGRSSIPTSDDASSMRTHPMRFRGRIREYVRS